jgi:hypothetical protein
LVVFTWLMITFSFLDRWYLFSANWWRGWVQHFGE